MALFLNEENVKSLLSVKEAVVALEEPIRQQGLGININKPRSIVKTTKGSVSVLPAAVPSIGRMGFKTYTVGSQGARFWLMLFDEEGVLLSLMEADNLGRLRTGGASGVATKHMSRPDSRVLGLLGSGIQAGAQIEAVMAVRPLEKVVAWGRTRSNLEAFCERMTRDLGIPVEPAATVKDAVANADIVTTITSAREAILMGDWLREGTHVNLVGAMKPTHREVDDRVLTRADLLVVDDHLQAQHEAGEFIPAAAAGLIDWNDVIELSRVVASDKSMRKSDKSITVFKSHGIGLWDICAANAIHKKALAAGVGIRLPIEQPVVKLGGPDSDRTKM